MIDGSNAAAVDRERLIEVRDLQQRHGRGHS
jgi:hypothetical protein